MPHFEKTVVRLPGGGCASSDLEEVRRPRLRIPQVLLGALGVLLLLKICAIV